LDSLQISVIPGSLFYGHPAQGVGDPQHGIVATADVPHSQTGRDRLTCSEGVEQVTVKIIVSAAAGFERDVLDVGLIEFVQESLHGMAAPSLRAVIGMAVPDDHHML
jgi:hypothetical protein